MDAFITFHSFDRLAKVDQILFICRHPNLSLRVNSNSTKTFHLNSFLHVLFSRFVFNFLEVGLEKHVMFVLLFNHPNKWEFLFYFCVDFSIHMEKLMRLLAVSEWFLELLFDFLTYCFELFTLINLWHLFWQNMNSLLFQDRGWCLYFVSIDLMLFREFVNEKFICLAFDQNIIINFVSGKYFRLDHFSVRKSLHHSNCVEKIFFYHFACKLFERFPFLSFILIDTISIFSRCWE